MSILRPSSQIEPDGAPFKEMCRLITQTSAIIAAMKSLHLARPYALMMVGIPGSGKSFFARQFADTFTIPYIDSLAIESRCLEGTASGELIALVLGEIVKTDQTFIFEGNSDIRTRRTEFAKWARSHGYQPLFVWTQLDQATALSRSLKMGTIDRDQFADILRDFSPPHPDEKAVVISGKHTFASQAKVVLGQLVRENRPTVSVTTPERPVQPSPTITRQVRVR